MNEVGRFFWNIGEWQMPSVRDFIRATISTGAIVGSVYFENEVLTTFTFLTIAVGNICILSWEWKSWGRRRLAGGLHFARLVKSAWLRVQRSLSGSLHQFAHMQLLGLQPLLERTLVEKSLGLTAVAAFSFLTSITQTSAGLLLVPKVARTRQELLRARSLSEQLSANRSALRLLLNISAISGSLAVIVYAAQSIFELLLGKNIPLTLFMVLIAFLSSVSAIFCSAISPLLTARGYAWQANFLTVLALIPLFVAQWVYVNNLGIIIIGLVALLLVTGRVIFIYKISKHLALEL